MSAIRTPSSFGRQLPTSVVARRLRKSERTVRWYARTGQIRAVRVGTKLWKYYESDVEAFRLQFCVAGEAT
jgi:predicted site-specific integrase-resolvase